MDANTLSAPSFFDAFAASIASSGLVSEDELGAAVLDAKGEIEVLAKHLLAKGWLTPFQSSALKAGQAATLRVGNYDILDRLGAGGMGTVPARLRTDGLRSTSWSRQILT